MKAVKKLTNQLRQLINFSVGSINFVKSAETESRVQCIPRLNKDSPSLKSILLHFALVTCLHVAQSHSFLFLGFIMHFSTPIKSQQSFIIYIILQYFPIFMYNKIQWTIFLVSRKLLSSLLEKLATPVECWELPRNAPHYLISHQATRAYKHVTMATYQKTSTNQIAPLTEALKVRHIHNNLRLPIGEDIPQSQFVRLCEMNTLQAMEIRPTCNNISVYMCVHW